MEEQFSVQDGNLQVLAVLLCQVTYQFVSLPLLVRSQRIVRVFLQCQGIYHRWVSVRHSVAHFGWILARAQETEWEKKAFILLHMALCHWLSPAGLGWASRWPPGVSEQRGRQAPGQQWYRGDGGLVVQG